MGKGSTRRRRQVSRQEFDKNWARTYGRKLNIAGTLPSDAFACDETSAKPDDSLQNVTFNPCEIVGPCGCEEDCDE